jgi:hypothetical protein
MRVLGRILPMVLVLASATPSFAQGHTWGLKGGVNLATIKIDEDGTDYGYRVGVVAGGYYTLPLGSRLEVQPEGLFSQQGSKPKTGDITSTIALDMLTVPVLVKFRFSPPGHGLAVYGGPSASFRLRARAISEFGSSKVDLDVSDQVKSTDFGVAAGAMFEKGRWTLDGRYTFGLTKLNEDAADPESKSRVISILGGLRF